MKKSGAAILAIGAIVIIFASLGALLVPEQMPELGEGAGGFITVVLFALYIFGVFDDDR